MAEVSKGTEKAEKPGEQAPPMVKIEHLVKQFGKLRAINNLNMTIYTGETFGLIGPNGSGKTTLIRMLVGLTRPTSGSIHVILQYPQTDRRVRENPMPSPAPPGMDNSNPTMLQMSSDFVLGKHLPNGKVAAKLGYMTQSSALYLDLTARENMRFFASIYDLHGKEQEKRISEMLERVELTDRANDVVNKFSGGMRQRLSLACALVHNPRLVLLDEPTVGVDPELRRSFWNYFHQLNQEGVTIIVSTHHLDEAARCTRLGLMRFGDLLAQGTPQELLQQSGKEDMEDAFLYFANREEVRA